MSLTMTWDREPSHWQLTLAGELDYAECTGFRMNIDRMLMSGRRAFVVDLSEVEYLDSSGLGLLLSLHRGCEIESGKLVLVTGDAVDRILAISGLSSTFTTTSCVDEAVRMIQEHTV